MVGYVKNAQYTQKYSYLRGVNGFTMPKYQHVKTSKMEWKI